MDQPLAAATGATPPRPAGGRTLHRFANPGRFLRATGRLMPILWSAALVVLGIGLAWGLLLSPPDWQQGETVRIMYVHVPMAWLAMGGYTGLAILSVMSLVWRHPLADMAGKAAAPIGAAFTLICLITGSLWGRPMWGTYWVWDARLTSVFVLFLMYLGVISLWRTIDDPTRAGRAAAILTLVGAINIPIIKFSVDWWNTLHQPASVVKMSGPAIHPSILVPLLVMAIAFTLLFFTLHLAAIRNEILKRRVRSMQLMQAEAAPGR